MSSQWSIQHSKSVLSPGEPALTGMKHPSGVRIYWMANENDDNQDEKNRQGFLRLPGWGAENVVGVKPIIFPKRRRSEFSLF